MLHPIGALDLVLYVSFAAIGAVSAAAQQPASAPAGAPRTVLVTGANRGLGLEFARQYLDAGWQVIATAREPEKAAELKALGGSGKPLQIEALDVTDGKSVAALADRLKDRPIDLLVNNAGVPSIGNRIADVNPDEFARVLQVNTIGPLRVTQALLKNLRAGKGKAIVSITSVLGSIEGSGGGFYGYRESKAALNMLMRNLAAELRRDGFVCIVMHPGWVRTDMGGPNAELTPEQSVSGMRAVIGRLKPEDSGKFWAYDGTNLPW